MSGNFYEYVLAVAAFLMFLFCSVYVWRYMKQLPEDAAGAKRKNQLVVMACAAAAATVVVSLIRK